MQSPGTTSRQQEGTGIDRREFLRLSTAVAAASALASAACQVPQETTVPFHDMPETLVDGVGHARYFRTVLDGSPVQVKTREGRPILITPVTDDQSGRALGLRHHAALMDLYDPDRARGPLSVRKGAGAVVESSWQAIGEQVVARLRSGGPRAALLTGPVGSPALQTIISALTAKTQLRHATWAPLATSATSEAWAAAFGASSAPRARLDKADLVLGLGAEFLDRPEEGGEALFTARRSPEASGATRMSRFIQLESRLTLTGASADVRLRARDSHLPLIAAALAHELIVVRQVGPLAGDAQVAAALAPHTIEVASKVSGIDAAALRSIVNELAAAQGRALVMAGGTASSAASGTALEAAGLLLNATLGAFSAGLFDAAVATAAQPDNAGFARLVADMAAGNVDVLIIAGPNPVYDAPAEWHVADAIKKVGLVVSMNDRLDETSRLADFLAPASHPLECWSDAELPGGFVAVQQPVIRPLHDTRGLLDTLVDWAAVTGDTTSIDAVRAATSSVVPPAATGQSAASTSLAWHYLRALWSTRLAATTVSPAFETAWTELLRTGGWRADPGPASDWTFRPAAVSLLAQIAPVPADALELQLYPHLAIGDGRAANNGWLQELPDPITRMTWGGALSMAPRRFDEMQLQQGDLVEIDTGHATIVAPAYRHAGMHHDQVALPLGLGRTDCGAIGGGVGRNAYPLRTLAGSRPIGAGIPVRIRKAGGNEALAVAQGSDVIDRARRPLVPVTTLSEFQADARAGTKQPEGGPSAWTEHAYPGARWAMAIDLSKCTGCAKCVIGCQAENNIPIVGRHGMLDGREMSWLRIDRYYDAPAAEGGRGAEVWDGPLDVVEEPTTLFEPMLCQHCENAPCETVCPFSATMHSEDGLNQQVYNRCVGTRYCANNCPFKVRRFNYWEMSKKQDSAFFRWLEPRIARNADLNTREPMQLKNNPEVTVRSRGVMEKCSFCVQRIRSARAEATRDGRSKEHFADGEVVPACMEACGTGAISFGDINAPGTRVAELAASPRAMKLLDSLGVKPAVSYLTKVRNDKA